MHKLLPNLMYLLGSPDNKCSWQDLEDLPALTDEESEEWLVYAFFVPLPLFRHPDGQTPLQLHKSWGLYIGSATGACGGRRRWYTYDHVQESAKYPQVIRNVSPYCGSSSAHIRCLAKGFEQIHPLWPMFTEDLCMMMLGAVSLDLDLNEKWLPISTKVFGNSLGDCIMDSDFKCPLNRAWTLHQSFKGARSDVVPPCIHVMKTSHSRGPIACMRYGPWNQSSKARARTIPEPEPEPEPEPGREGGHEDCRILLLL